MTSLDQKQDGAIATVIGTLSRLEERITQQGRKWASANMTVGTEQIEVLVFPENYPPRGVILTDGRRYEMSGRVDRYDGALRLMVDRVVE